jgi:predicted RNA-binding protein YlqC (UPF0109 family)
MKNTEKNLILAISAALMGQNLLPGYRAAGTYADRDRWIELDYGHHDVGPVIGSKGSMKLAIQTLIACPFGGDAAQIHIRTTQTIQQSAPEQPGELVPRLTAVLQSLREHYPAGYFDFRIERSQSALVVLIDSGGNFVDSIRGALSKVIRSIGRRHGLIAVVSIES